MCHRWPQHSGEHFQEHFQTGRFLSHEWYTLECSLQFLENSSLFSSLVGDFETARLYSDTSPLSMPRATKPGHHYDCICEISRHVPVGIGNGHGRNAVNILVTLLRLLDLDCGIRSDAYHTRVVLSWICLISRTVIDLYPVDKTRKIRASILIPLIFLRPGPMSFIAVQWFSKYMRIPSPESLPMYSTT
ncbi:hypothetical protein BGY98DRAFT_438074 [Russula aff. rugulosa BPL654]|nr:hypothetical protein BGY98DRAFT_438074 [Russula aff. rugulosa BPL654]